MSKSRIVKVVAVSGTCNAGLEIGDTFLLEEFSLPPGKNGRSCLVAFATLIANIGRLKLQEGTVLVSCPDPGTGAGGNVIFELCRGET